MSTFRGAVVAARATTHSLRATSSAPAPLLNSNYYRSSNPIRRRYQLPSSTAVGTRSIHTQPPLRAQQATAQSKDSSNPALSFPCLDAQEAKSASLSTKSLSSGPEPSYTTGQHQTFHSRDSLLLDWGGVLPEFDLAYETWGTLNADRSNVILLHTGLSASSHAHSTEVNPKPGWWEKFIGPGAPLDTDKYFVICTNVIGGCFGSTGPSSVDPSDG